MNRFTLLFAFATVLVADDNPFARSTNRFAVAAHQELARSGENTIFSPISISTALSMVLHGAREQTASEMANVLGQTDADVNYHEAAAALAGQLASAGNVGENQFLGANALWVQKDFEILPDFLENVEKYYGAPPALLDFIEKTEEARGEINSWTEEQTKGRIRELFPPGVLDSRTRLVLTSAVYFYGKWARPFMRSSTRSSPFQLADGGTTDANFMTQTGRFSYGETDAAQILEMIYADTGIAFDIVLPKSADGLAALQNTITPEDLSAALSNLEDRTVEVSVPKFRVESKFALSGTLSQMGMPLAFSDTADFSGIDGRRDLALTEVMHKAFIEVTEEGTEAAAATGVSIGVTSIQIPTVRFVADHPFAFLIRDTKSGLILFAGQVVKPQE